MYAPKNAFRFFTPIITLAALVSSCSETAPSAPDGDALNRFGAHSVRSLDEFIFSQGHAPSGPINMRAGAIIWQNAASDLSAVVDYAGAIHRRQAIEPPSGAMQTDPFEVIGLAPPVYEGSVIERVMFDGSARVTVELFTRGALTYAVRGLDVNSSDVVFGSRGYGGPQEARSNSRLFLVYRSARPGLIMPDIAELIYAPTPAYRLEMIAFSATGFSLPDPITGTSQSLEIAQPGLRLGWFPLTGYGVLPAAAISLGQ